MDGYSASPTGRMTQSLGLILALIIARPRPWGERMASA